MKLHILAVSYRLVAICCLVAACTLPEVKQGDQLAAKGDWDGAVAAYRGALKKKPFDEDIQKRLTQAKTRAADQHYAAGRQYLKENRLAEAVQAFKQALSLDPSRIEHQTAVNDAFRLKEARDRLHDAEKLKSLGRLDEALTAYEQAVQLDPDLTKALEGITAIAALQAEQQIGATTQPITLRFQNAKLKEVFEILARAAGLNVLLDKEVKDEPVTIFIKDTPFPEALNLILSTNGLFAKRIGPDTLLISPNTKPKQDQYQDLMIRTYYLSNAKAKEVVNLVRTMLESKRVYVNEPINALVVRDTPDKLKLAERIILANDRREAEVELELEVLEVDRTLSQKLGVNFAKSAGAGVVPPGFTGSLSTTTTTQFTYQQLTDLGPDSFVFSLPASVLLDFFKQESNAKTLAAPKLRVLNGKQASVNVGDKQPILLSTTNVLPGQAATGAVPTTSTVTSIEFKDTGIKLTVEPVIHLNDELTLKLKVEVTRLGDLVTLQSNPLIQQFRFGTRMAETTLNMKDDESVVLAGLIQDEERKTRQTVPGLGDIPVLGALFSTTTTDVITTEVVLTITPRIIRNVNVPGIEAQAFWSGTEANYATAPLFPEIARKTSFKSSSTAPAPAASQGPAAGAAPRAGVQTPAPGAPTQPGAAPALPSATPGGPAPQPPGAQPGTGPGAPTPVPLPQGGRGQGEGQIVAGGAAVLAIRPPELSAFAGQEFAVELLADNVESMAESTVTVSYDPKVLEFRRAVEGEFLTRNGVPGSVTIVSATPAAGQVTFTFKRQGAPIAGSGVLGVVFFQGKAAGSSAVDIQDPAVSGAGAKPIPVTVKRGLIRVR